MSKRVILNSKEVTMFNLTDFISTYVTKRPTSMFLPDIEANKDKLQEKIQGKTVLVIGGAGSIGSSFISKEEIVQIIKDYLPGFNHIETGKSLDGKM